MSKGKIEETVVDQIGEAGRAYELRRVDEVKSSSLAGFYLFLMKGRFNGPCLWTEL